MSTAMQHENKTGAGQDAQGAPGAVGQERMGRARIAPGPVGVCPRGPGSLCPRRRRGERPRPAPATPVCPSITSVHPSTIPVPSLYPSTCHPCVPYPHANTQPCAPQHHPCALPAPNTHPRVPSLHFTISRTLRKTILLHHFSPRMCFERSTGTLRAAPAAASATGPAGANSELGRARLGPGRGERDASLRGIAATPASGPSAGAAPAGSPIQSPAAPRGSQIGRAHV